MRESYEVNLSGQEKGRLRKMIRAGWTSAQAITQASILPKTDEGWTAPQATAALDVLERTVRRAKRHYERRSLGTTSNLDFSEWERIFANTMATAAVVDRVVHHSVILEFDVLVYGVRKFRR